MRNRLIDTLPLELILVGTTFFLLICFWMISSPDFEDGSQIQKGDVIFTLESGLKLSNSDGETRKAYSRTYPVDGTHRISLATDWSRAGVYYACLHEMGHLQLQSKGIPYQEDHDRIGWFPGYSSKCNFILTEPPF